MTLEDRFDPPTFASNGADRWIKRNVEINGADAWESLANIEVGVFFEVSPGFIVWRVKPLGNLLEAARSRSRPTAFPGPGKNQPLHLGSLS